MLAPRRVCVGDHQTVGDDYVRDDRGLTQDGDEMPILAVWRTQAGTVRWFWAAEGGGTEDPGQDAHLAPALATLWNVLDLTPGGRGTDGCSTLEYPALP